MVIVGVEWSKVIIVSNPTAVALRLGWVLTIGKIILIIISIIGLHNSVSFCPISKIQNPAEPCLKEHSGMSKITLLAYLLWKLRIF